MKWITATNLQQWGARLDARSLLVELVADLIRASNPSLTHFRFPVGDKGQVRGFDGNLESSEQTAYVPKGQSIWEFGVSPGIGKAQSDFEKRNAETTSEIKKLNTLVLVNLNAWNTPKTKLPDWLAGLKKKSEWADIKYIDGSQLESWLDNHPAVAARYAKNVLGIQPQGVQGIEEYWNSYSTRFKPTLLPEVLLCERESHVKQLLDCFRGGPQLIMVGNSPAKICFIQSQQSIKKGRVFCWCRSFGKLKRTSTARTMSLRGFSTPANIICDFAYLAIASGVESSVSE